MDQTNLFLPAHLATTALVNTEQGLVPPVAPLVWLIGLSLLTHWAAGRIHRGLHPLARLGRRLNENLEVKERKGADIDHWELSREHGQFWSRRGLLEQALWGLTTRRERLALEAIANGPLRLTRQWGLSLLAVIVCLMLSWLLEVVRSDLSMVPGMIAAIGVVVFIAMPPVNSRQKIGGNVVVIQNPFPFLPVSAQEVFFALAKGTIVKSACCLPHVLLFAACFSWLLPGVWKMRLAVTTLGASGVVWFAITFIGVFVALVPITFQSNIISITRVKGWIAGAAFIFAVGGPMLLGVLIDEVGLPRLCWLLTPFLILSANAWLTFWMWREGTYDFTGVPLISKGTEQLSPTDYNRAKGID